MLKRVMITLSLCSLAVFSATHAYCAENGKETNVSSKGGRVYDVSRFRAPKATNKPNLLVNGSFEKGSKGWNLGAGDVVARPFGRNGSAGLRHRRSDPSVYNLISQRIPVKAGMRYEFGVWVKTQNITGWGNGAGACIEFTDKTTGKYVSGLYSFPMYKGTTDWTKISGEFSAPANTNVTITLYIRKGMVGEAVFDDVYVKQAGEVWCAYMCNPVYNTISLEEPGKSLATFAVTANGAPSKQKSLVLQLTLDNGFKTASKLENGMATFDFSDAKLTMGKTYKCTMDLLDIARRTRLHTRDFPLQVRPTKSTNEQAGSIVRFNKNNVAIVNGEKFMPLGFYVGWASDRNINLTKEAGGNVMLAYSSVVGGSGDVAVKRTRERLDRMHAAGIKLIFSIKQMQRTGYNRYTIKSWGKYTEASDIRREIVKAFRDHPTMLAWYMIDENPVDHIKHLIPFRQHINELDPNHPTFGVHYYLSELGQFSPCWDVAGIDPYTIAGNNFSLSKPQFASSQARKTSQPIWAAVEIFNNGTYDKKSGTKYKTPTEEQIRGTMLQMAGEGVKGFLMFRLDDVYPPRAPEPGMFKKSWPGLCRTFKLFRELEPYIVSDNAIETVPTSVGPGKVGAYRLTDDSKREVIILTVVRDPVEAVINVKDPSAWQSRYGKTEVKNGKLVFKGKNMDSDVLFKSAK